jgi:glycerol-3-phosphate dehydrogenase (NAD(P)+)
MGTHPIAVLGGGNWGSTLAQLIALNNHPVRLWTRTQSQAVEVNERRTNTRYVPGLTFAIGVRASARLRDVVPGAGLIVFAIPSQAFRAVSRMAADFLRPEQLVVHVTKGLEVETHARMSQILIEETCVRQLGVLSGPNIAAEIGAGHPAGTVIASHFPGVIAAARSALTSDRLLVFSGEDVVGTELAGALKNIVAIAAGMAAAMDVGENAKALLVTRGLAEITALATRLGAKASTFSGLAGVGDLVVTCASRESRNHRLGEALAQGESLDAALAHIGMVAEGIYAAKVAHAIAGQQHVDVPLLEHVYRVLYERLSPAQGLHELMHLAAGHDVGRFQEWRESHSATGAPGGDDARL